MDQAKQNHSALRRGLALFLGLFTTLNLALVLFLPGFDGNLWWIDLRVFPSAFQTLIAVVLAGALLNYALQFSRGAFARRFTLAILGSAVCILTANTIEFFALLARGNIITSWPLPITLILALSLLPLLNTSHHQPTTSLPIARTIAAAATFAIAFAFLQMLAFGKTDYRRHGDIAVVFGARVYANGALSDAVLDRVTTACGLYHQGHVRKLLFSGGPGDGAIHETEAMREAALRLGIPASAIILDQAGLNTRATAQNTAKIFNDLGVKRALAVTHFYHLPRVKLAYQQQQFEIYTVPAHSPRILAKLPLFMTREALALAKYYFDPLLPAAKPI